MSKRFTETEKWSDPWFRKLTGTVKIGYLYLLDRVDNSGVIDLDRELADFQIGMEIDWEAVREELGDRVEVLACGKWHLTRFVRFQFGELKEDCKPHAQVMRLQDSHQIQRIPKGYPKGINTLKDKDKEQDKDTDKGRSAEEGGQAEELPLGDKSKRFTPPSPEDVAEYSRSIGYPLNGQAWCDSYAQKGWKVGKNTMKDWKAAVRTWKANGYTMGQAPAGTPVKYYVNPRNLNDRGMELGGAALP